MKHIKKASALLLAAIILFCFAACGSTDKKDSKKDKASSAGISDSALSRELEPGKAVTVAGKASFYIDYCQITPRVNPPKTSGVYSYYAADEGKVYIDICLSFKNLATEAVGIDDLFGCEIVYDGAYKYSSFITAEEDNRSDLRRYGEITPLSQEYVHILAQVPEEVQSSSKKLSAAITFGNEEYTFDIRNNITGQTSSQPSADADIPASSAPSAPASNAQSITDKQVITLDGKCEFFVDFAKMSNEVRPPQPTGAYSYYPAEDGKAYVDLCISYKSLETTEIDSEDITSPELLYAGAYKYTGFTTTEQENRSDFSRYVSISPLTTEYIHLIIKVPEVVISGDESIEVFFSIAGTEYCYKVR